MYVAKAIACTLSLILAVAPARSGSNCTDCIIVNSEAGDDNSSCIQSSFPSTTPCKSLRFVFDHKNISNREILLQGDHYINDTLTISDISGLTLRGSNVTKSTIYCRQPEKNNLNDKGSGLFIVNTTNFAMLHMVFENCGTLQKSTTLRENKNVEYRSAVYIINSTNISISETNFRRNVGRGLSLYDVSGYVSISNCEFFENKFSEDKQESSIFEGGGMSIEFTHCSPGYPHCNKRDNTRNKDNFYVIKDCVFEGNRASNNEVTKNVHIIQFRLLTGSDANNHGQGGGMHITIKGTSLRNYIAIINCTFHNNSAQYGGGIDTIIQDNSQENIINVTACTFTHNSALERNGGALRIGFTSAYGVAYNIYRVQDTKFISNSAGQGGAVAFFASRTYSSRAKRNKLRFVNCVWEGNTASIGAAMSLGPTAGSAFFSGSPPIPYLSKCVFINNQVVNTAVFLRSATDERTKHQIESGVLDIESIEVDLDHYIKFDGSTSSAIFATFSQINVLRNTQVEFFDNRATYGGAISLLESSVLQLYINSHLSFVSNHASELGGAVYATSPYQAEFIFSHRCFISATSYSHPDMWKTSLEFINNTAKYGSAIYVDSLFPCAKYVFDIEPNVSSALRWKPFMYSPDVKEYTIATSPAVINFTIPTEIAPGERISLNSMSIDDLNQTIVTAYQVFMEGMASTIPYISDGGFLQISGKPNTTFNLTLKTLNSRHVSMSQIGRLGNCPLGFVLVDNVCVCSTHSPSRQFLGVLECDTSIFRAFLQIGYWIGCSDTGEIVTSYCPPSYCNYPNASQSIQISRSCDESKLCIQNRRGQICGQCEEGYSVFYHSENFKCGKCPYGAIGLIIYVLSELIPLVILFAVIMVLKLKMTSGLMQSLLLFAQTITFINRTPSVVTLSPASQIFLRIHSFLLGFLSLEFFRLDALSFCLWKGATVLHNLMFRYVTTLFSIFLLTMFILIVQENSLKTKINCCKKINNFTRKKKLFKNSIVHGITTVLILSYTQYTVTSFQILSRISLHGEGGVTLGSVVALQGNVDYFGTDHLPYAIPAVLVLLFLSLPPPLLLISYPLLWKIKGKFKCNVTSDNDATIWPIRKLLPLFDSFQGVFRDNYRMFAGLFFLWRVILTAVFALSSNLTEFFLLTQIALLYFFTIHAVIRPYKRQLFNIIDIVMFANMSIINALSWYTSVAPFGSQGIEVVTAIRLILMYIPLVCLAAMVVLWFLRKSGIIQEKHQMCLPRFEDEISTVDNNSYGTTFRKTSQRLNVDKHADDELFARAAEVNHPPLVLNLSREGYELQSQETNGKNTNQTVQTTQTTCTL